MSEQASEQVEKSKRPRKANGSGETVSVTIQLSKDCYQSFETLANDAERTVPHYLRRALMKIDLGAIEDAAS